MQVPKALVSIQRWVNGLLDGLIISRERDLLVFLQNIPVWHHTIEYLPVKGMKIELKWMVQ